MLWLPLQLISEHVDVGLRLIRLSEICDAAEPKPDFVRVHAELHKAG